MNIKRTLIGLSATGLITASLSLSACGSGGGGGGGSSNGTPPTPVARQTQPPTGFTAPAAGTTNPTTSTYLQFLSGLLANLALPQGVDGTPVQFNAPAGITQGGFTSAFYQLFNFISGAAPTVIVTSGTLGNTVLNVTSSPSLVTTSNVEVKATPVTVVWNQYQFGGVTSSSSPIGLFTNNTAFIGTSINPGGSFLAMQNSTTAANATPVSIMSQTGCKTNPLSTQAVSIANTSFNNGNNYIAIGTNYGELLVYGVAGQQVGQCQNLTSASKVAAAGYVLGSPIGALSYTNNRPGVDSNNYGYIGTQNGQIWRITATSVNQPTGFVQLNSATGVYGGSVPPAGTVGLLTALYSDADNNVYVGDMNGNIYLLAAVTSTGAPNTTWTKTVLGGTNSAVLSISGTTNGSVIANTANGIYNISLLPL